MSDRKYRQSGYQDSDRGRDERPQRDERPRPSGPVDRTERPRGRGLGAPTAEVFRCARCGESAPVAAAMAAAAVCGKCGADLRTCTHCVSFDTASPFECRQRIPTRVSPKDRNNRCELFAPRLSAEFAREQAPAADAKDPRAAFNALFKF
jgi:hypothetical protein